MRTKEKILEAALRVFALKGYDGATTREIAALAKQRLFTLSYHFGSKRELYASVINHVVENVSSSGVMYDTGDRPPEDEARKKLSALVGNILRGSLSAAAFSNGRLILFEQYLPSESFSHLSKNLLEPIQNGIAHYLAGSVGRYDLAETKEFQHYSHSIHSMGLSFRIFQETLKSRTGIDKITPEDVQEYVDIVKSELDWIVDGLRAKYASDKEE